MVLFFWGVWRVLFTLSIDYPTGTGQVSYVCNPCVVPFKHNYNCYYSVCSDRIPETSGAQQLLVSGRGGGGGGGRVHGTESMALPKHFSLGVNKAGSRSWAGTRVLAS